METTQDIELWVTRQRRKAIKSNCGINESVQPNNPKYQGISVAGGYLQGFGSNVETAKRLHKEILKELSSMKSFGQIVLNVEVVDYLE